MRLLGSIWLSILPHSPWWGVPAACLGAALACLAALVALVRR